MEWVIGIFAIMILADTVDKWFKRREKQDERETEVLKEHLNSFSSRLSSIESRLSNIETIVIEHEKSAPYDALRNHSEEWER